MLLQQKVWFDRECNEFASLSRQERTLNRPGKVKLTGKRSKQVTNLLKRRTTSRVLIKAKGYQFDAHFSNAKLHKLPLTILVTPGLGLFNKQKKKSHVQLLIFRHTNKNSKHSGNVL